MDFVSNVCQSDLISFIINRLKNNTDESWSL